MASRFYSVVISLITGIFGLGTSPNLQFVNAQVQTVQDIKAEADKLVELGKEQFERSHYQEAAKSYQSALILCRLIKEKKSEIISLQGLGDTYGNLRQYKTALEFYQQALTISKQLGDLIGEVKALIGHGYVYSNLGDFQKGITYYQQAIMLAKLIGDRKDEANTLYKLGLTFYLIGDYNKTIDYQQQSLVIGHQINNRKEEVDSLIVLGIAYDSLGYYQKAIDYQQQSLAISKQTGDLDSQGNSLSSIGNVYGHLGLFQKAIDYYQLSLDIIKKTENRYNEGSLLISLGFVYNSLGQYKKGIDYFQQSIVIAKQLNDLYMEGDALWGLGRSYKDIGNYQKAIDYYQQSLGIFELNKYLGANYEIGELFKDLGIVYSLLGQNKKAIDYYQRSLEVFKRIDSREGDAETLNSFGNLFSKLGQSELAILFYKQSVNIRESIRKDIRGLSKEEQKSYLYSVEDTYRNLANLLLKQDRILEAQQVLDLLKVQELSNYLKTVRGNNETAQGVDLQLPEQNIIALTSELNALQQKDRENKLSEPEKQRLSQLVQTEKDQNKQFNAFLDNPEIKQLIDQLHRVEDQNIKLNSYRKLQKDVLSLYPNAVLLYPLILDDRLELILINSKIPPLRRTIKIKREELNQAISDFRSDAQDTSSQDIKKTAQKLYNYLIRPFETELKQLDTDTIIYAPDGQLRYIPLAGLYDGKQWLAEKYRVNNITSESLTALNRQSISQPHILAGAFGGKPNQKIAGFVSLPATITEVRHIADRFPNTTTLIESAFTKEAIEIKADSHNILHLATHGELSTGKPEDSFILFGDSSKITIRELQDWRLKNVDLVVLSACQTGLGKKLGTGVEILGLGYQMQAAGARVAIASLWKVDDAGTQALMDAFYGELQKGDVPIAEALRRAQVSLIKSQNYNHPNYWSAFFAIGNGL